MFTNILNHWEDVKDLSISPVIISQTPATPHPDPRRCSIERQVKYEIADISGARPKPINKGLKNQRVSNIT